MAYVKNDPAWVPGAAPGVNAARLAHLETQYDEAATDLAAKLHATTGHKHTGAAGDAPNIAKANVGLGNVDNVKQAAEVHNLVDTTKHPVAGLTIGHFLKATGAAAYAFGAHGLGYSDVGADASGAAATVQDNLDAKLHATTGHKHTGAAGDAPNIAKASAGLGNVTNDAQLPLAGGTLSGEVIFADQLATRPKLKDYSETTVVANTGANYAIDLESGNVFELTLTAGCTFTFTNPPASGTAGSFTLILKQDATGSRTTAWPASVKWVAGTAPTLTTTASAIDVLVFVTTTAGTVWYGMLAGAAFATPA